MRQLFGLRFPFFLFVLAAIFGVRASAQDLTQYASQIRGGSVEEKREALFQLRNLRSPDASRVAIPALRDSNKMVRATAAASVVFLPPYEAAAVLIPILSDKDEFPRREAAYALGKVGHSSATARLVQVFKSDKSLEVRAAAAVGLGGIGDVSAIEPLSAIFKIRPNEDEEFLRRSSARAIGQTAQLIQTGVSSTVTPQNFLPERYKHFRERKHTDLVSEFPEFRPAVLLLIVVLQNSAESDDTRREAAFSLGAIGDAAAINALEKHVSGDDPYLAEICREALLKIKESARNLSL